MCSHRIGSTMRSHCGCMLDKYLFLFFSFLFLLFMASIPNQESDTAGTGALLLTPAAARPSSFFFFFPWRLSMPQSKPSSERAYELRTTAKNTLRSNHAMTYLKMASQYTGTRRTKQTGLMPFARCRLPRFLFTAIIPPLQNSHSA